MAEVLITLGIIGIVAAMTLPTMIANYQKRQTVTQLKKAYTSLGNAIKLSEIDNGELEYWEKGIDMGISDYMEKYWLPYFNEVKVCKNYSDCGYSSITPWKNVSNGPHALSFNSSRIPFITGDGILYFVMVDINQGEESLSILVDLNASKQPNRRGRDVFLFSRSKNGVVPESGYNCFIGGYGSTCANKIMQDGWQIKDDYPW